MRQIIDISVPIRERMPIYPGNPGVRVERVAAVEDGDDASLTRLDLGVHTGTHVDAPGHVFAGGDGIEAVPLDPLVGPCVVVDATAVEGALDAEMLARVEIPDGAERILFKTTNSELWASPEFAAGAIRFTADGAEEIVRRGVRLVGIDYLSVGDLPAHHVLIGAGVVCVEGLDLRAVEPGAYELACLPLRLPGADGAPARAILMRD